MADTQDHKRCVVDANPLEGIEEPQAADPLRPCVGVLLPQSSPVDWLADVGQSIEPFRQGIAGEHNPVTGKAVEFATRQRRLRLPIAARTAEGQRIAGEVSFGR